MIKPVDCLSVLDLFELSAAQEDLFVEEIWPVIDEMYDVEPWGLYAY